MILHSVKKKLMLLLITDLLFVLQLSGNRFCDEKNEWLTSHKESSTLEEVLKQKAELAESLHPILSKLEDHGM